MTGDLSSRKGNSIAHQSHQWTASSPVEHPKHGDPRMSLYRPRIGSSTFSGRPFQRGPGNPVESPSLAATIPQPRQPLYGDPTEPAVSDPTPAATREADLVCLADVEPQPVDWPSKDRLATGTLYLLSGDPGSGKTWVVLAIAAASQRREPGNLSASGRADPRTVLYDSSANAPAELVLPASPISRAIPRGSLCCAESSPPGSESPATGFAPSRKTNQLANAPVP
jgi:hypothetical protein